MARISDIYIPGIGQTNPPRQLAAERASDTLNGRLNFTVDNLEELRAIKHNPLNLRAFLKGMNTAGDGLLQGDYYWEQSSEADNGVTVIRGDDYTTHLWKKYT